MAENFLNDRERHVALQQLDGPGPANDFGCPQFPRYSAGRGPLVKLAPHMAGIDAEKSAARPEDELDLQGLSNLGRQHFWYLHVTAGRGTFGPRFAEKHRVRLVVDVALRVEFQHFVQPGAGVAYQEVDQEDAPAGHAEPGTPWSFRPVTEGLLQVLQLRCIQAAGVFRNGKDPRVGRECGWGASRFYRHRFRPSLFRGSEGLRVPSIVIRARDAKLA